jgi:iron-sulfur cluster repair protein YtfE (RIC family)
VGHYGPHRENRYREDDTATESVPPAISILLAEHDQCRQRLDSADAALAAGRAGRIQAAQAALDQTWALLQFLETELEAHIAKEEGPLFPRLKAALPAGDRLIDEMVAEHDLIRIKRSDVESALAHLVEGHDGLRLDRVRLRAALASVAQPPASLLPVQHAVDVVATKLRVHFENEEELVFPLAPQLLTGEELEQIAVEMAALSEPAAP